MAFLSVFCAHSVFTDNTFYFQNDFYASVTSLFHIGIFGVNFFFVLSGFLITWLLIEEKRERRINIPKFYIRRVLRIWPVYYLVLSVGFVVVPFAQQLLGNTSYQEDATLLPYIFFYNNFISEPNSAILGILWSIAVEEQFYLLWPIILMLIPEKYLGWVFFFLIIFSFLLRTFFIGYGYTNTFSCMSDLAMGGYFAFDAIRNIGVRKRIETFPKWTISCIYVIGVCIFLFRDTWSDIRFIYVNERLLFSIFFGFVIVEQCFSHNSIIKIKEFKKITYLGRISYGLYMYHFIAIYVVSKVFELFFEETIITIVIIEPLISFLMTLLIAYVSFRYFESYFLKMKRKFAL